MKHSQFKKEKRLDTLIRKDAGPENMQEIQV